MRDYKNWPVLSEARLIDPYNPETTKTVSVLLNSVCGGRCRVCECEGMCVGGGIVCVSVRVCVWGRCRVCECEGMCVGGGVVCVSVRLCVWGVVKRACVCRCVKVI